MFYPKLEEAIALLQSINNNENKPPIAMKEIIEMYEDHQANLDLVLHHMPVLAEIIQNYQHTDLFPDLSDYLTLYQMMLKVEQKLGRKLTAIQRVQGSCFLYDLHLTFVGKEPLDFVGHQNEKARYDSSMLPFLLSYFKHRFPPVDTYETLIACGGTPPMTEAEKEQQAILEFGLC